MFLDIFINEELWITNTGSLAATDLHPRQTTTTEAVVPKGPTRDAI